MIIIGNDEKLIHKFVSVLDTLTHTHTLVQSRHVVAFFFFRFACHQTHTYSFILNRIDPVE